MYLRQVFKHYFEELEEESLRDNFVVVVKCWWTYELSFLLVALINSFGGKIVMISVVLGSMNYLMK